METQTDLTNYLIQEGVLKTKKIIDAFNYVDRADFVAFKDKDEPYGDFPLSIGYGQTISQPTTVVLMLELLEPKEGDKVLDVGSGSGWTTALLSHIAGKDGKVFGVEIVPQLIRFARRNLEKYNFKNEKIIQAGDTVGLAAEAPFDKILVSAAATKLPNDLVSQLKTGGRMVLPIENSLFLVEKFSDTNIKSTEYRGFVFVPLK